MYDLVRAACAHGRTGWVIGEHAERSWELIGHQPQGTAIQLLPSIATSADHVWYRFEQ